MVSLLPYRLALPFSRIEPYGFPILILLLFTGVLGYVMWPLIGLVMFLISAVFGLPVSQLLQLTNI
jgi:hypothetical protein